MEVVELELFSQKESDNSVKSSIKESELPSSPPDNPQKILEKALNAIFIDPQEENKIAKARNVLGPEITNGVSDEQLDVFINEVQYLLNGWFDEFEKQIFDGPTLREILRGEQNGKF